MKHNQIYTLARIRIPKLKSKIQKLATQKRNELLVFIIQYKFKKYLLKSFNPKQRIINSTNNPFLRTRNSNF